VSQLAEDVQRHLDHEPVLAHAPSAVYGLTKFVLRHRGQVIALGLVLAALGVGLVGMWGFWREAEAQTREAQRQEAIAQARAREAEAARTGEAARAKEAADNALLAQRNAAEAMARRREFDQLAAMVLYERALASEKRLYPAWPNQIGAMERWLRDVDAHRCGLRSSRRSPTYGRGPFRRATLIPETTARRRAPSSDSPTSHSSSCTTFSWTSWTDSMVSRRRRSPRWRNGSAGRNGS